MISVLSGAVDNNVASPYFQVNVDALRYRLHHHGCLNPDVTSVRTYNMSSSPTQDVSNSTIQKTEQPDGQIKFSIDNILGLNDRKSSETSSSPVNESCDEVDKDAVDESTFSWLQCTRYKPPKLQRLKKKDSSKKRKLGRNPRVPFSQHQVAVLEEKFRRTHYLSSLDVAELSAALSLSETRVKIWFQNRRARERRDRDAVQHSQVFPNKNIQPLSIPNITWPMASSTSTTSAFAQFRTALEFSRSGYITSAFSLYPQRAHSEKKSTWTNIPADDKETDDNF